MEDANSGILSSALDVMHVACIEEMRNACMIFMKPERKRKIGSPTRKWENKDNRL
jgi:hypothetical protein